jgi:uncharacterized protein YdaU (DUF1376 family)
VADKTDAWMPLWIGAYLADTQHLSRDEHGGYLLLLMAYWRARAPLPDDDKRLSAIVKASAKEWRSLRPVLAEFFVVADGAWRHKRVDEELAGAQERKTKASGKAKAAAEARWKHGDTHAPRNAPSNAPSIAQALHKECPTPSPTPSSVPIGTGGEPPDVRPVVSAKDEVFAVGVPMLIAAGQTEKGARSFLAMLVNKHQDDALIRDVLLEAAHALPGEPVSWIQARLNARPKRAATTETYTQRAARERAAQFAPRVAARADGAPNVIDMESANVPAIASR